MTYSLENLAADVRDRLARNPVQDCADELCGLVRKALLDAEFRSANLPDRPAGVHPRKVLYEDPELGFCICGHVYPDEAVGSPHDHGSSWAIYGQAEGETEMTDWRIVQPGGEDTPSLVEPTRTYKLVPGDAHFYDVGAVHSPNRIAPTRLVRIEGANLDNIQRSNIAAAS